MSPLDIALHPCVHLGLLLLLILRRVLRASARPPRLLVGFTLCYFVMVFASPVPVWLVRGLEHRYQPRVGGPPVEWAVVLTGRTLESRKEYGQFEYLSSSDRILEPIRMVRKGQVQRLLITGADPRAGSGESGEAFAMRDLAIDLGVPADHIVVESESRNTRQSAEHLRALLPPQALSSGFLLVTSALHMPRAMMAFEQAGLSPTPFTVDYKQSVTGPPRRIAFGLQSAEYYVLALHEYVGILAYRVGLR